MRKFSHILITGGAGFIGSNFVRFLVAKQPKIKITVLDKLTYAGNEANLTGILEANVELVIGDICDQKLVNTLVAKVDGIVNFAAESHVDNSLQMPITCVRTNVDGVAVLLEAARKYGVFFHQVSTDEVFGDLPLGQVDANGESTKFTLDSPYRPSSPYAASKASADMLVRAWHRSYQIPVTISICSNNYGPWQHQEKFIPHQILALLKQQPIELYGSGNNVRDWIHVEDHVQAIWQIITHGKSGQTYLVSANNEVSNRVIAERLLTLIPTTKKIKYVSDRPGHDLRYALDAQRTREELDWAPKHQDILSELPSIIKWYLERQH